MSENNGVTGERQVVVFDLNEEAYGVDISQVREITRVPRAPEFIEGIINLRGNVIPVADLRASFSMPSTERTDEHGIVVVDVDGQDIGMVVDAVTEVSRTPSDSIEPPSSVITTDDSEYLTGIVKTDDKLIILLDIAKVISESEASALEEIQQSPDAVAA